MIKRVLFSIILGFNILIFLPINAQAQLDYLSGVISNIPKGHSAEAMGSLSSFKANLLGCLVIHNGNESVCKDMDFPQSSNFNYQFSIFPQDGSKIWAIKARGIGQSNLGEGDTVVLTSDDQGQITCQGSGKLVGVC